MTRNYTAAELSQEILSKKFGLDDIDYATSLNNLAAVYRCVGNYQDAEALYKESEKILLNKVGIQHPSYAILRDGLARVHAAMQ
jgi:hypothetical protein